MESQCLSLRDVPHTSRLHSAYLDDFSRVSAYYGHPPTLDGLRAAAAQTKLDPSTRAGVVGALRAQNQRFGPSETVDPSVARNLDRLGSGAAAIVTGQQVGLFTGPAYSIYKALTAIRTAAALTDSGVEAVPVFWLASEDHDLAEVDHCMWPSKDGMKRLAVKVAGEGESKASGGAAGNLSGSASGRPVGQIAFDDSIAALVSAAVESLDGPSASEISAMLREAYRPGETFSSAFGKLVARLLQGRGLILLDPQDASLQRLAAPVYRRALTENAALVHDLTVRNKALEHAGFHAQVRVAERATLLFLIRDGRRTPLRAIDSGFAAGDSAITLAQLEGALEKSPEKFSANVLLRPVVQDSLLPTAGYVAGPSELAYYAQASVVYQRLLGRMPVILPRAAFTLVEPRVARLLRKYHLQMRDMLRGRQHLRAILERESIPRELTRHFSTGDKNIHRYLARLRRSITRLDPTLAGALSTAERKILFQLEKLRRKVGRALESREALLDAREETLRDALYPHRGLQERELCLLPFLARQGITLLDELQERALPVAQRSSANFCHQVLFL
ncbi:MAG: bacillithiol biosynthesis cysteine-adding enzyme BshC [Acidipila sp.]|nr:bacillithiol biosynthesis cysteine-adding enzyme BshC [Acidipila sp.]